MYIIINILVIFILLNYWIVIYLYGFVLMNCIVYVFNVVLVVVKLLNS